MTPLERAERLNEILGRLARTNLTAFLNYVMPDYSMQWFHKHIAHQCQLLIDGNLPTQGLMVFISPQHGKTEIVSRKLPAWALGRNPALKIVGCSYSADLAQQFSRAVQRTIESDEYKSIFPDTQLPSGGRGYQRNVDYFDIVGGGFYKAVGVGGSLTGTPADLGIIDDPVKDAMEAYSKTYRDRVWNWYTDVFLTRLHNRSKQLLIMTRWHEDDLAGRLLDREPDKWTVVSIPAICEVENPYSRIRT